MLYTYVHVYMFSKIRKKKVFVDPAPFNNDKTNMASIRAYPFGVFKKINKNFFLDSLNEK